MTVPPSIITTCTPEIKGERRRALRALLRNPLLPAEGDTAEEYILARRHSAWLKHWLAKFPEWTLHIGENIVRLRKLPPDLLDETRQAVDRATGTVFSRRRYALLCLALAALERSDQQTTLGQIAGRIMEFVSADQDLSLHGVLFDIGNYDQRRDLIHAVRLLIDMGVLCNADGDERDFLNRNVTGDVSYDINRPVLAAMLNVSGSASAIERTEPPEEPSLKRAAKLIDAVAAVYDRRRSHDFDTAGGHRPPLQIRSRLVRILLDDPILYFHELNDEERLYLEQHRSYLLAQIYEAAGLRAEVRREGIAMVDDEGGLTDVHLPEDSTDGHLSLLVAGWLAEFARNDSGQAVPLLLVEQYVGSLIRVHGSRWRKEVHESGAETQLTEHALLRLRALRLIRVTDGGIVPLPACGRYAACDLIGGTAAGTNGN